MVLPSNLALSSLSGFKDWGGGGLTGHPYILMLRYFLPQEGSLPLPISLCLCLASEGQALVRLRVLIT